MRLLLATILLVAACGDGVITGPEGAADSPFPSDPGFSGEIDPDLCASININLMETTPTVMLLVDRSGTMRQRFGGTDRWNAVYQTLMGRPNGVVTRFEDRIRFGLAAYTSRDGILNGGTCPLLDVVPAALDNYDTINRVYSPLDPVEDTPTGAAMRAIAQGMASGNQPGPKVIVLATDGEPDTCEDPQADDRDEPNHVARRAAAREDSVAGVVRARDLGIQTFVVSVGGEVAQSHLQDLANAGAGVASGATFYQALGEGGLADAFEEILGMVRGCSFTLNGRVNPSTAGTAGTVTFNGQPLVHEQDWILRDETTLEIVGAACDRLRRGAGNDVVEASFTCQSVVL